MLLNHVVNLEDCAHELRRKEELLTLRNKRVEYTAFLHVVVADAHAVDAEARAVLVYLSALDGSEILNGSQTTVLGKR